jgi:hypothetical protein
MGHRKGSGVNFVAKNGVQPSAAEPLARESHESTRMQDIRVDSRHSRAFKESAPRKEIERLSCGLCLRHEVESRPPLRRSAIDNSSSASGGCKRKGVGTQFRGELRSTIWIAYFATKLTPDPSRGVAEKQQRRGASTRGGCVIRPPQSAVSAESRDKRRLPKALAKLLPRDLVARGLLGTALAKPGSRPLVHAPVQEDRHEPIDPA